MSDQWTKGFKAAAKLANKEIEELEAHNRASNLRELKLQSENEELETQLEAVNPYVRHEWGCIGKPCKCGLDARIKAAIGEVSDA